MIGSMLNYWKAPSDRPARRGEPLGRPPRNRAHRGRRGVTLWIALASVVCLPRIVSGEEPSAASYATFAKSHSGDSERGARVFLSEGAGCARCHSVGGKERLAGPNLLGIADKYSRDQLIDAILKPDAYILAGYATATLVKRDGQTLFGIVKERTPEHVELFTVDGKTATVAIDNIVKQENGKNSLMPSDLHKATTPQEFADLVAYLGRLKHPTIPGQRLGEPDEIVESARPIAFEPIHDEGLKFRHPVWLETVPGDETTFAVVEHDPAKIWLLRRTGARLSQFSKSLFVALGNEVERGQHKGIMGICFHPRFAENGKYYVYHHVLENGVFGSILVERLAGDDRLSDSGAEARLVLRNDQRTDLHTGGMLGFGPDGFLYVGTGDGGPQEDLDGNSQSLQRILGAILRVDVDGRTGDLPYAIPPSNPFVEHPDPRTRRELWAIGLRQPWRFSWDPKTGDLWVGDVGQNRFEEITIVRGGENHGWNVYEGFLPFSDRYRRANDHYVPPVVAMARKYGASITGGYVYRGGRARHFDGVYIFGDYESKRMWGLRQRDRELTSIREIGKAPDRIASFAVDRDGELYLLGYDQGMIYRLVLEAGTYDAP